MRTKRSRSTRPVSSSPSPAARPAAPASALIPRGPNRLIRAILLLLALGCSVSCQPPASAVQIRFLASYAGQPIGCEVGQSGRALSDLRFYVHDVEVVTNLGRALPFELTADASWQNARVALLDLEDGQGHCTNGTSAVNRTLRGQVALNPDETIDGLKFSIGVPEDLNHANPMTAAVPLNYSVMHWHWRSGYKFMRAGLVAGGGRAWLHLGSARCAGTIGNIEGCRSANRPTVIVPGFDPATDRLVVDVATILGGADSPNAGSRSCESGVDDLHCRSMFAALGLDPASGQVMGPAPAFYAINP